MKYLLVPSLCLATLSLAGGQNPSAVAIKDAHVVTVSGADLPKGTVLLKNGLIEQVGAEVTIPPDAWVIDGAGLIVYPGFIDALSTWGIPNGNPPAGGAARTAGGGAGAGTPATNQTRVRGPEDRPQTYSADRAADMVSPTDNRLEAARAAGFTSAATYPNRGIFMGQGAVINLAGERGRDMVLAQPVGQQVAFRVGGGGMGRAFPSSLMGNISYIRQLYLDLAQYKQAKKLYTAHPSGLQRPQYDHALEGLAESPRLLLPAEESQQIDRMISFGQELKVPFLLYGLHEAYKEIDQLKTANVPALVSLKWPEKPRNADPTEFPNYRDLVMRDQAPAVPAMFVKAGIKFAFYSDGLSAAPELKKAIKRTLDAGLKREDAIRALTLNPAEIYGVADRLGSIEKGKIGNLVVMRGPAFEDKSVIEYVFIDGKQFQPSKDLQQGPPPGGPGSRRPTFSEGEGRGENK
ncbi:MAG: amidohydrolase family protein [Bryobacteraceae bacterium]